MERMFNHIDRHPFRSLFVFLLVCSLCVWAGYKPPTPPPSVFEEGIKITKHTATPEGVSVAWETEDPRVTDGETEYVVEFRKKPIMLGDTVVVSPDDFKWKELGRTKDKDITKDIYLLDSTYDIRVRADITGKEGE